MCEKEIKDWKDDRGPIRACVDTEWRPWCAERPSCYWPTSILQLALGRCVVLVDLLALRAAAGYDEPGMATAVEASIGWLFKHTDVQKVGFGLARDVQLLCDAYPAWRPSFGTVTQMVRVG